MIRSVWINGYIVGDDEGAVGGAKGQGVAGKLAEGNGRRHRNIR